MSDPTAQEPTMEEILASIRRIISEDDAPAAGAAEAGDAPPAAGAAPHAAEASAHESDDVLELTQRVEPQPEPAPSADHTLGDLDVSTAPEPKSAAAPEPAASTQSEAPAWEASAAEVDEEEPLIADHKADAAATHFGSLAKSLTMPAGGRTLEDVVREMLRPLLKEWLDQHLQQIVETRVQDEVERISRRRVH